MNLLHAFVTGHCAGLIPVSGDTVTSHVQLISITLTGTGKSKKQTIIGNYTQNDNK